MHEIGIKKQVWWTAFPPEGRSIGGNVFRDWAIDCILPSTMWWVGPIMVLMSRTTCMESDGSVWKFVDIPAQAFKMVKVTFSVTVVETGKRHDGLGQIKLD